MGRVSAEGLANKSCVPCRGGMPPLSKKDAEAFLAQTPGWRLEDEATRLKRAFEFRDFVEAIRFVNRVADIAESEGHHPDIAIHWNRVELTLWTHKIGGLHENDFILAAKIGDLLRDAPGVEG
jgi:4a-hydroxytetrahydrobiopterin dehydratase